MKHAYVFLITFLFALSVNAQYPEIRYRDPSVLHTTFYYILNTSDSALLLSGYSYDTIGDFKRFITKLDTAGNIMNAIYCDSTQFYNGCSTSDGGYLMTGIGGHHPQDFSCLIKMDDDLNIQWIKKKSKNPCSSGSEDSPKPVRIGQTIYYAEQFFYCNQRYGIHLFKTDESGNLLSQTVIGDSATNEMAYLSLRDIYATSDSHLVVIGIFLGNNSGLAYIKMDTNFTILSSTHNRIDGYHCANPLKSVMLGDESILIFGSFEYDCWSSFAEDYFLMKFSPGGNVQFMRAIETNPEKALTLFPVQLSESKYALIGRTMDTLNFDGVPISILFDSSGTYLNSQYENLAPNDWFLWQPIKVIGSSLYLSGNSPKLGTAFTVKTDLNVMGTCSPSPLNVSISPVINVIDSAVQLYHSNGSVQSLIDTVFQFYPITLVTDDFCEWLSVEQQQVQQEFVLSPNPTTGKVFISNLDATLIEVEIFNLLGEKVLTSITVQNEINISSLQPGIYILEIHVSGKLLRSKVVKQ